MSLRTVLDACRRPRIIGTRKIETTLDEIETHQGGPRLTARYGSRNSTGRRAGWPVRD
jgi:hypothetical protein